MKLKILAAVAAAGISLVPAQAEAQVQRQLQFFNTCPVAVRYFVAFSRNGAWQTYGWFNATGNKPAYSLLDSNRNPILVPEGTRVHYYAETTGQPAVRWVGNVNINMRGALYPAKPVTLSVRGGKFQFGLNCDKEMRAAGYDVPARPTAAPVSGGRPAGQPALGVGSRVLCNFKRSGAYFPGRIGQMRSGGAVYIEYDDGDREWSTLSACRRN